MKKLLRILGTVLGLLLVVGYFAFSTYFFSPFEGGLDADVAIETAPTSAGRLDVAAPTPATTSLRRLKASAARDFE